MYKRVYVDLGNGQARGTNMLQCDQTGQMVSRVMPDNVAPVAKVRAGGYPLMSINASAPGSGDLSSISPAEDQLGQAGLARREYMSDGGATVRTYRISFDNGSGAEQTAVIGDGNTIVFENLGVAALPGTVTIGGTWGASSLAIWKLVTSNTPVRVDKVRINFDTTSYLTTANLIGYKTRPDAIVSTDDFNINSWVSPDQYQSLIIENPDPLRIVWDASFGMSALLPAGRSVTFTFYYTSVADVHNMRRVAQSSK